jgi:cytochrome P450
VYAEHITGGALNRIQGEQHLQRRRLLNQLLRADGHAWYRDTALYPMVDRTLAETLAKPDPDGIVRTDLEPLMRRLFTRLAAGLVGLDHAQTDDGAAALEAALARLRGAETNLEPLFTFDAASIMPGAVAAWGELKSTFYGPARCLDSHGLASRGLDRGDDLP